MTQTVRTALIIGASRGLGLVLAEELSERGWDVIGTARTAPEGLGAAGAGTGHSVRSVVADMRHAGSLDRLHAELADDTLDLLFINGAINRSAGSLTEASDEEFVDVFSTNTLAPMRVIDALADLVTNDGTIAVMSSEQGSISQNTEEGFEVYKASKAALNQLMRSYANRTASDGRTKLLIDPGHNRTVLGGEDAPLDPRESMARVASVLETSARRGGLSFLDRNGSTVPW